MKATVNGKEMTLTKKLGEGGEAVVYSHGGKAIKIYHPQILNRNLEEKLKNFPATFPERLIGPENLAYDRRGNFIGYVMKEVKDAENLFLLSDVKHSQNFSPDEKKIILLNALETLGGIHRTGIIVGDLNSLNVIYRGHEAFFIDADSMQFGAFPCEMFTEQYLDPLLYGVDLTRFAYSESSDHYAFTVIIFESLLLTHPFGGTHPKYPNLARRAENRISVFTPGVVYPKAAIPWKALPDELNDHFLKTFEKGERKNFPKQLLENLEWTTCTKCGKKHARSGCPYCYLAPPAAVKQMVIVNRKCVAEIIKKTGGRIILAKVESGQLKFLFEEGGIVRRENGERVLLSNPDNFTRFEIMGGKTIIGRKNSLLVVEKEKIREETDTGMLGNWPVFGANSESYFRLHGDMLVRGENKILGQILEHSTWMKVGPRAGFGFYRVGKKTIYFLFDVTCPGINDRLDIPSIDGHLIDAECVFSENYLLFLHTVKKGGKLINSMYLLDNEGNVLAKNSEEQGNSLILSGIHNKTMVGARVLTASDEGLILLEVQGDKLKEITKFTDTEPFVTSHSQILAGREGIYVVDGQEIKLLKLV